MTDRQPWRCPDCGALIAPHVDVHFCDEGPDGGVTAKSPRAPKSPFTTTSVTTSFPGIVTATGGYVSGGTTVFVGEHGPELATVTATINGRDLFRVVQAETLKYETRKPRRPDAA